MATINGTNSADILNGTNENDVLNGFGGDDTLNASFGSDVLNGGDGIDTAIYAGKYGVNSIVNAPSNYTGGFFDLAAGTARFTYASRFGYSTTTDTLVSIENLVGTLYDDTILGSDAGNAIYAHNGDDTIDGRGGNDSLFGENGHDTLYGGAGNDLLNGGNGTDTAMYVGEHGIYTNGSTSYYTGVNLDLAAGTARITNVNGASVTTITDTLVSIENVVGTLYNDNLRGDDAANAFYAHNGNDILDGRCGDDQLFGEAGNDILYGGAGRDLLNGGAGIDQAIYAGEYGLSSGGVRLGATINLERGTATLSFASGAVTDTLVSIENVVGTLYNDTITGSAAANSIYAHNGNDVIYGGAGNDKLFGEAGNDKLFGGLGNDQLTGGDGADRFYRTTTSDGFDTITDYCRCEGDVLDLLGAASRYQARQIGEDVVIRDTTTGQNIIKLADYALSDGLLIV